MRKTVLFSMLLLALTSCGSKETILTPQQTKIKGDLGNYYAVVDKEYHLGESMFGDMVQIELIRLDSAFPENFKDFFPVGYLRPSETGRFGFGIEIFDEEGNKIVGWRADQGGSYGCYSTDDLQNLWELEPGETNIVRWSTDDLAKYAGKKLTFKVSSYARAASGSSFVQSDNDDDIESSSSSKWDNLLNKYENFVDSYVRMYKKAVSGDLSAMDQYEDFLEKAEDLSDELEDAEDEMSSSQWNRYMKITQKIESVNSDGNVSSIIASSSDNWDKVLDEFEAYVNQYAATYKKAMQGDMTAMTEYTKLAEKAQKLSAKLEKAKGEMSNSQMQRYLKILKRMTDVIQDM